jgi:hypothetical protein
MTEAQRYPGDYDGIVAGDPAFSILHLKVRQLWTAQLLADHPEGNLPKEKIALVASAAVAACLWAPKSRLVANHSSPRMTKLYDRREEESSLDEFARIVI